MPSLVAMREGMAVRLAVFCTSQLSAVRSGGAAGLYPASRTAFLSISYRGAMMDVQHLTDLSAPAIDSAASTGEFRRGWKVLIASMLGIGCGLAALPFYTMGVFAPHLAREFGWSMGQIMAGLTCTTLAVMVAAPVAGILAERYSTRKVALGSLMLFGLAYLSLATLSSLPQFYITFLTLAAVGAGTLPITWTRTVNRWFDKNKGVALGLAMMGTGLFGIVSKPGLAFVIGHYGWRTGFAVLGALPLLLALPVAVMLFRDPSEVRIADNAGSTPAAPQPCSITPAGLSRAEAFRSWRFWLIAAILLPISFALAGPIPNLEAILTDRGLAPATILTLTPLVGLASIAGRLIGGWLLDHFWAPAVAFVILGMPAISCMILANGHLDPMMGAIAIGLLGFALGIEYDVVAFLTARYFGLRAYSAIYAIFYVCFSTGAGFAPMVFGAIRDRHHDFAFALQIAAIILPVTAALFLLLGRYPRLDSAEN
jgi:MFS family permease